MSDTEHQQQEEEEQVSEQEQEQEEQEQEQEQGIEDDEGVVINNSSAQQSSHQQSNSQENQRYKQHEEEQDEEDDQGEQIQNDQQDEEEEERVVRAGNLSSLPGQKLLNQASIKSQGDKKQDIQRLPSGNDNDKQAQANESQKLQKQTSNHQQKLQQEQQNYQEQQQKQLQRSKSQQEQILFSQFLNEMLDQYRTTQRAFKAIDRHNKGFIELNDLAIELSARFGIESEAQQKEIFVKLGHGNSRINRELFDESFHDIVQDRQQQQQQLLSSMNVVTQSYDPTHSPFKDKQEREDIINVFANKNVNLDEANKVEHFGEDCLYAPVIRRLRQQPNFNEFVRSYNSLQFPKYAQQQPQNNQHQPFSQLHSLQFSQNIPLQSQQMFLRHELFSNTSSGKYRGAQSLLDEYKQSAPPLPNAHPSSGSPLRQLKISAHTFSPNRFYKSLDSPKEFAFERKLNNNYQNVPKASSNAQRASGGQRFMSPQYNRKPNQTFLGFEFGTQNYQSQIFGNNQMRSSQGNLFYKPSRNNMNNSKLFASQELNLNKDSDFLHRSSYMASPIQPTQTFGSGNPLFQSINFGNPLQQYNNNIFSGIDNPLSSPKMAQSSYISQRIDLRNSPNQNRLNKLKRNVNLGLESLAQVNKPTQPTGFNQNSFNPTNNSRNIKDQFNQFLSQLGGSNNYGGVQSKAQPSPQRYRNNNQSAAYPLDAEGDRFGDILSRLGSTGNSRTNNRSLEKRRYNRNVNLDVLGGASSGANASPFRSNSFKRSQSPTQFRLSPTGTKGGVVGQMQRVRQIQASLRALPNKQKVKFARTSNSKNRSSNYYDKK